jgi:hypothetical protein
MFSQFSLDSQNLKKLDSLGLAELTEVIQTEGISNGQEMVTRWLHLESDPEVIAAQKEESANEINEIFDLSTLSEVEAVSMIMNVDIPPPSPPPSNSELFTLSEATIKSMLLKYASAAIASNINESVLLVLLRGIKDHIS